MPHQNLNIDGAFDVKWFYCFALDIHTADNESLQNKTKKMCDISAHLMTLIASGIFLWVIYGFIKSDPVIIGTNATDCSKCYFISYEVKI